MIQHFAEDHRVLASVPDLWGSLIIKDVTGPPLSDFATSFLQNSSKPVQMMSMKKRLRVFHIERPQAVGLQLYYESRDLSLLILLPDEIGGLDQVKPSSDGKTIPG